MNKIIMMLVFGLMLVTTVHAYNIACFGDSITKAGMTNNSAYCKLVCASIGNCSYTNYGINGLKVYNETFVVDQAKNKKYTHCFMMIGTNDRLWTKPYYGNLTIATNKLKSYCGKTVLLMIPPAQNMTGIGTINYYIRQVANETGLLAVDIPGTFNNTWSTTYFIDSLHPNDAGQKRIANKILSYKFRWI